MAFRSNDSFTDQCTQAMNKYRTKHQVPPLKLNAQISRIAQKWAEGLARSGNLRHNDSAKYNGEELGENIAMRWSSDGKQFSGEEFVEQWYEEVKNYDFRKHSGPKTGHFTQLVWKGSVELGVGKSIGPDGKWMVVANFYPAGNFLGDYQNNVFPPQDGKITLKVSSPANALTRVSPRSTANDSPYSRASPAAPFNERQELRSSPQPGFVVGPSSRPFSNSPSSFFASSHTSSAGDSTNATFLQRQVRTETIGNKTKTIEIETYRNPDGTTKTVQKETTSTGKHDDDVRQMTRQFGAFQVNNDTSYSSGAAARITRQTGAFQVNHDTSYSSGAAARAMPAPSISSFPSYSSSSSSSSTSSKSPWTTGRVHGGSPSGASRIDGTSSQGATSNAGSSQKEFNDDVVRNHNQYRRQHGAVGDLRVNSELCGVAQKWAEHLASGRILKHSGASFRGERMGENLACKYGTGRVDYAGKEVVKGWYDEIKDYSFRNPESSNFQKVGHFTQVVWKGSQEVGIGKATSNDGAVFVVCNYIPAGNVIGRFRENVFPAN